MKDLTILNEHLEVSEQTRQNFLKLLESHPQEKMTSVASGFSNHPLWNFGHALVTFYLLTYQRCAVDIPVSSELIDLYRKGSGAKEGQIETLDSLKIVATEAYPQFRSDLQSGLLSNYSPYMTSYGISLNSLEEAVRFNTVHESLHLGYAMAQYKALG